MAELDLNVKVNVSGEDRLRSIGSGLRTVGAEVVKWGAVGVAAFGALGVASSGFASDLNESLSKLNVVFPKSGKAIENWSKDSAESLGLSQQAAVEAAGTFGNFFQAMGTAEKPAAEMSTGIVELASDLASFNNIGTDVALEKLRAGLAGEAEPLRQLGVSLSAARVESFLMEKGIRKVNGQFTEAQKAQARYAIIMEDTTKAQGDFNRTSDGMANQQRILQATFQDSMAQIGQAFVPIIQELLPKITAGLKAFAGFIVDNMPLIKSIIGAVFTAIGTAIGFVIDEVVPRLIAVFQFIATNVFPLFSQAVGGAGGIFATLGGIVNTFVTQVMPTLIAIFQSVVGWIGENLPTISSVFGQVFGAIVNVIKSVWPVISAIATVLFPLISTAAGIMLKVLDVTFKAIGGFFEVTGTAAQALADAVVVAWEFLTSMTTTLWEGITGIIRGVLNGLIDVVNGFFGFLNGLSFGAGPWDVGPIHIDAIAIDPFNIPLIPHLAEGGIISSPTLALLGEAGPEAVVPLNRVGPAPMQRIINLDIQAPLRADDAQDIAEYIDRVERLEAAMEWNGGARTVGVGA